MDERRLDDVLRRAEVLQMARRHLDAIALLEQELERGARDPEICRRLALVYRGRAEAVLDEKEQLGRRPDEDELAELDRFLKRGLELDPRLPDLHWNLAVISARFLGRFDQAQRCLAQAKELGCGHPMMSQLENLIREG